jgi:hypothetical protein
VLLGTTDPVNLLFDTAEAPADTFRATELRETYGTALDILIEMGALALGPPTRTVGCRSCDGDHAEAIEFDPATGRSFHFCPEAGLVTVDDANLATLCFNVEWLVDWLIRELSIRPPIRRRALLEGQVWHLGDALHGTTALTIVFARCIGSLAAINHLASALEDIPSAPVGLVATTSTNITRRIAPIRRYEFLDLREIIRSERDGLLLDKGKLLSWIEGHQGASANHSQLSAQGEAVPRKARKDPARLDYRVADRPLIEEMRTMICCGKARNATDAARAIVKHATGDGNEASKVTRLASGYLKHYPSR